MNRLMMFRPLRLFSLALVAAALAALAVACGGGSEDKAAAPTATPAPQGKSSAPVPAGFARPELIVDTAWLASRIEVATLRVIDVRPTAQYAEAHIPGAVNLPMAQFATTRNNIGNELPTSDDFAKMMANAGVSNNTQVVIYDEGSSLSASRLLWTLEYFGHAKTSILNGGIAAWKADERELSRKTPDVQAAIYTPHPNEALFADKAYVLANLQNSKVLILDARSPAEYDGTDVRSQRGGHVPGAKNVNWTQNNTEVNGVPTIKPAADLKALYEKAGLSKDKEIVGYCQTAVRSSHSYFALRLLGYDKFRNYDGAWAEWGNDTSTPIEK
ncbi:MAG: sulfurtransferase [Chloroflexi bacterium]|nr:sulfurtransferase [Chloroflexota bacterium]